MGYATLWLFGFGVLLAGYLVLAGLDYGVAIVAPFVARDDGERRLAFNALGPFFLSNEVWLLVAFGVLFGTAPRLGTSILTGTFGMAVVAVAGALLVNVAVQLRSRVRAPRVRRTWDGLIFAGGVAAAFGWGAVITAVIGGLALGPDGHVTGAGTALTAFSVLGGLSMVALLATHGSMFLAARTPAPVASRARRGAIVLSVAAGLLLATTMVTGRLGDYYAGGIERPTFALVVLLLAVVLLKVALWLLTSRRYWAASATTATAVALMPVLLYAGKYPALITPADAGGVAPTLGQLVGEHTALAMITWTAGPVLVAVIAVQAWSWWAFRGRLDRHSPIYY